MLKVSKMFYVKDGVCSFYTTLHTEYCYSSHSCQRCQRCQILLYSVYRPLAPARREGYLFEPSVLGVWQFTTSQSVEAALLTFLDLSTTRVIAGKTHSQSPILKLTKEVLSNPVILTYLWEQGCILHTLTKLPA